MSTLFRIPTLRQERAFTLRLGPPTSTGLISDQGWPTPGGSWFRPSARSAGDGEGTGPVPPTTSISPSTAASSRCVPKTLSTLCDQAVFVDEAAGVGPSPVAVPPEIDWFR